MAIDFWKTALDVQNVCHLLDSLIESLVFSVLQVFSHKIAFRVKMMLALQISCKVHLHSFTFKISITCRDQASDLSLNRLIF